MTITIHPEVVPEDPPYNDSYNDTYHDEDINNNVDDDEFDEDDLNEERLFVDDIETRDPDGRVVPVEELLGWQLPSPPPSPPFHDRLTNLFDELEFIGAQQKILISSLAYTKRGLEQVYGSPQRSTCLSS